ncbi:MAG: class I SAM-dependent methyltransferase [Acidobacteriota bacterium]
MNNEADTRHLYDWLSRYNLWLNWWRYRDRDAELTMHKTLRPPADAGYEGAATWLYVNDLALEAARVPEAPRVLDAGCGFGGTMFRWYEKVGGRYDGLTLSRVQQRVAERVARKRGIADCRFLLQSYDDPLDGLYDTVVVIEALIHSPDFATSFENLWRAVKPGGTMVIVEDVARASAPSDPDFTVIREHWGLADVPDDEAYARAMDRADLELIQDDDHSAGYVTQSLEENARRERQYRRLHRLLPFAGVRVVLDAYIGGVALERLHQNGHFRYRLLAMRKRG